MPNIGDDAACDPTAASASAPITERPAADDVCGNPDCDGSAAGCGSRPLGRLKETEAAPIRYVAELRAPIPTLGRNLVGDRPHGLCSHPLAIALAAAASARKG
jgi:hypothetical protein